MNLHRIRIIDRLSVSFKSLELKSSKTCDQAEWFDLISAMAYQKINLVFSPFYGFKKRIFLPKMGSKLEISTHIYFKTDRQTNCLNHVPLYKKH